MQPPASAYSGDLTSDFFDAGAGCTINFDSDATTSLDTYGPLSAFTYRNGCFMYALTTSYGTTGDPFATSTYGGTGGNPGDVFYFDVYDPIEWVNVGTATNGNGASAYTVVQWVRFGTQSGRLFTTFSTDGCFTVPDPGDEQYHYNPNDPFYSFLAPDGTALLALGGCVFTPGVNRMYISALTFFWGVRESDVPQLYTVCRDEWMDRSFSPWTSHKHSIRCILASLLLAPNSHLGRAIAA